MTQAHMTMKDTQQSTAVRKKTLPFNLTWHMIVLAAIIIIAVGLRLINAAAFADGNTYYTAAVENMLQSPSNFFYAVADAGGITVDKPPVALWIQAGFAALLGVSGFSVTLPSIIAGVSSVLLTYHLVKRWFGVTAGLVSALMLAITPISVAVDRTNNLDSILILFLLLATWAFIRATETGQWRHLMLGALLIGVAFNVKMLQAYLILPALYALYFFGASVIWRRKVAQLAITTGVLVAVSLSWAVTVDLTSADQRPYVGGSDTNSVVDLAFGYNGISRLLGDAAPGEGQGQPTIVNDSRAASASTALPDGGGAQGVPGGSNEIGEPGITRLFESALANELAWLLPFGLLSIGVLVLRRRVTLPLTREHQAVVLWGGWLVTGIVFFSVSSFFHAYYLATLAPALAALVGIGSVTVWHIWRERPRTGTWVAASFLLITLIVQLYTANLYDALVMPLLLVLMIALVVVITTGIMQRHKQAAIAYLVALLIVPATWASATALDSGGNTALPQAYAGTQNARPGGPRLISDDNATAYADLVDAIQSSGDWTYDLVVDSSMTGSRIILATNLDVLYLGGFSGEDSIYTPDAFAAMVNAGEIGYVMGISGEIGAWVTENCSVVEGVTLENQRPPAPTGGQISPPGMAPPDAQPGTAPAGAPPGIQSDGTLYACGID